MSEEDEFIHVNVTLKRNLYNKFVNFSRIFECQPNAVIESSLKTFVEQLEEIESDQAKLNKLIKDECKLIKDNE